MVDHINISSSMFSMSRSLGQAQRLALGVLVLLTVDIVWVMCYGLTQAVFKGSHYEYDQPFFTTYVKTGLFSLYLLGFLLWKPWKEQCCKITDLKLKNYTHSGSPSLEYDSHLGNPMYVPVKYDASASGAESDDTGDGTNGKSVRFNSLSEVRQLSDEFAEDAVLSRLSHQAFLQAEEKRLWVKNRLSLEKVMRLATVFCVLWVSAMFLYKEALRETEAGIANILASTCGLFTLICAAIYPGAYGDKFTLSKFFAVLLSFSGVVLITLSKSSMTVQDSIPVGALWALASAMFYAFCLVMLRYRISHEDFIDIPMFLGFVGLVCTLVLWPAFFVLHYSKQEVFVWPSPKQWLLLLVDGLVSTVFSISFWLWGCFLTSSLVATLALSLIHPLFTIADLLSHKISCSFLFYLGTFAMLVAFFVVVFLTLWDTWDPLLLVFKKLLHCFCRWKGIYRIRELDKEQMASLIDQETA